MKGLRLTIPPDDAVRRLDSYLTENFPDESRTRIQAWIAAGRVLVDGVAPRSSLKLRGGEIIDVDPAPATPLRAFAEKIPLEILYEDDHIVAINKPAGMTVHAGAGQREGTLVNALLYHFKNLSSVSGELRPGIVHRLDRFTSGVVLVAKNDQAHRELAKRFERREVRKVYQGIVHGPVPQLPSERPPSRARWTLSGGRQWLMLDSPIGRDPRQRARMAIRLDGRQALTRFRLLRAVKGFSFLEIEIDTGRTHQIRVHLSAIKRPVVGDRMYGAPAEVRGLPPLERFFLHAARIELQHPIFPLQLCCEAPLPSEFTETLVALGL